MLICQLQTISYSQQENTEYLNDISDLVATSGKGFQIQIGTGVSWTKNNEANNYLYNLPYVIPRFAFNDHWGIQGEIGIDLNQTMIGGQQSIYQAQVSDLSFGAVYEFDPELQMGIFNQFSVNLTNTILFSAEDNFYSELDLNSSTPLSKRTELDYTIGYGYQVNANASGVYTLEIDYYLSPKIKVELSNNGQWNWLDFKDSFIHAAELEILFLSKANRQFNLGFLKGINYSFNYIGLTFIQNL